MKAMRWVAAAVAVACGGTAAAADGVWSGVEVGKGDDAKVALELRGGYLIVSDAVGVWQARVKFDVAGPGTKGGDLLLDADLSLSSGMSRLGKPLPGYGKGRKILAKWRENSLDGHIKACLSAPAAVGAKLERPTSPTEVGKGIRCFDLTRVADWTPSAAPAAPATPEPSFECMRECRASSQMKAMSQEAIDADCRRTCTTQ